MIHSGRTRSVEAQLRNWYEKEKPYADREWIWGFHKEAIQRMLDSREAVPFRCFFVRYILAVHEGQIRPILAADPDDTGWLNQGAEEVMRLMEDYEEAGYEESPGILRLLTDLVFGDFISNGFYIEESVSNTIEKVRGCVNRGFPTRGQKGVRPVLWGKNELLKKIKAKKLMDDEWFAFAFGMNMDYDDIVFFMKKALCRAGFNLWNWKEFLLYLTYRYAEGNIFEFYLKLKEAYEDERNAPKEYEWKKSDHFSTTVIEEQTDVIARMIKEEEYTVSLDENGNLPGKMVEYICNYKYLIHTSKDYTRTGSDIAAKLLKDFREALDGDEEAAKITVGEDLDLAKYEKNAQGNVTVYYDPEFGLKIPKGTEFYKIDKKTGKRVIFVSEEAVDIEPYIVLDSREEEEDTGKKRDKKNHKEKTWKNQEKSREKAERNQEESRDKNGKSQDESKKKSAADGYKEVEISLICVKKEKKQDSPERQYGYVPKKSVFQSDNPYVTGMTNKSYFKTPTKAGVGEETQVAGKITARCKVGKIIPAGTRFWYKNQQGRTIEFESVKEADASAYVDIWVYSAATGQTATKNEIVDCNIEGWRGKFLRLENSKIGFKQKKADQNVKGGVLYNYLYLPGTEDYSVIGALDEGYADKLAGVLEGTQLSTTKLWQIENKTEKNITRNDILTLSFLAYMSEIEEYRISDAGTASQDYEIRCSENGFMQRTNDLLIRCGYHQLYAPNPYDSLLMCLVSSNEGVNAFRNLWSWYLTRREK